MHLPMFFVGTAIVDSEFIKPKRPLDYIRNLNIWWSILRNLVLLCIFLFYGSNLGKYTCEKPHDHSCEFFRIITFDWNMPKEVGWYFAATSIIVLALVSPAFQYLLNTCISQFFGKISYMLYLIHCLFI
jgi:hypothetical protein